MARIRAQYQAMGIADQDLAWLDDEAEQQREGVTILAPNATVFDLFLACAKQWEVAISPMGHIVRTGLRWPDVETRARHLPRCRGLNEAETDRLWRDLETLQAHALEKFAEMMDEQ